MVPYNLLYMKTKKEECSIWTTDWHLHEQNIDKILNIVDQLIDLAKELNTNEIIHGGDVFTSRKSQSIVTMNAFKTIIKKFRDNDITFYVIPGNHDKVDYNSTQSWLDFFDSENFYLIDQPESFMDWFDNIHFHFLPYFDEKISYGEYLSKIDTSRPGKHYLFTHVGLNDVLNNTGKLPNNTVSVDTFDRFDKVFIGHYHNRQLVNDSIIYTGSTIPTNFGEDNEKGFMVVYQDGTYDFYTPEFDEFVTHEIDSEDLTMDQAQAFIEEVNSNGNNNRIVVTGNKLNDIKAVKNFLEQNGVKVESKQQDRVINTKHMEYKPMTDDELAQDFDEWLEEKKPSNESYGVSMFNKVIN